jgi:hypothetical protein
MNNEGFSFLVQKSTKKPGIMVPGFIGDAIFKE